MDTAVMLVKGELGVPESHLQPCVGSASKAEPVSSSTVNG
jgi:hypothetical protein